MRNLSELFEHIEELEKEIGYTYTDKKNLVLAMTHSSYANENKSDKLQSNERLEFLGDAVLNIVVSEYIYLNYPNLAEGDLTKARASTVCESSLVICANKIELGRYLLLGRGEENTGGRKRVSILSDAFEALIASIYLDSGIESAKAFIYKYLLDIICSSVKGTVFLDYKTQLQEKVQKKGEYKIIYEIIEEKGPDHDKKFVAQVIVDDHINGIGGGRSKKEAEQNAAKAALEKSLV